MLVGWKDVVNGGGECEIGDVHGAKPFTPRGGMPARLLDVSAHDCVVMEVKLTCYCSCREHRSHQCSVR